MAVTKHRYGVEWSAPNYRNAGFKTVMAANQREAVAVAKRQLGKRVKKQGLNIFRAFRIRR